MGEDKKLELPGSEAARAPPDKVETNIAAIKNVENTLLTPGLRLKKTTKPAVKATIKNMLTAEGYKKAKAAWIQYQIGIISIEIASLSY
jgi:hypothetical protein